MTTMAQGARGVMRVFTRASQDKNRNKEDNKRNMAVEKIAELRQISRTQWLWNQSKLGGKKKRGLNL